MCVFAFFDDLSFGFHETLENPKTTNLKQGIKKQNSRKFTPRCKKSIQISIEFFCSAKFREREREIETKKHQKKKLKLSMRLFHVVSAIQLAVSVIV